MSKVIPFQRKATTATKPVVKTGFSYTPSEILSEKRKSLAEHKDNPLFSFFIAFLEILGEAMRNNADSTIDYVDYMGFRLVGNDDLVVPTLELYGLVKEARVKEQGYTADKFIVIQKDTSEQHYKLSAERDDLCITKVQNYTTQWMLEQKTQPPEHFLAVHVLVAFAVANGFSVAHYNIPANYKDRKYFFIVIYNPKANLEYRINVDFSALEQ